MAKGGGGFGGLPRVRTRKRIRTVRSIRTSSGRRGEAADLQSKAACRDRETERLMLEEEQVKGRRALHQRRRAIQRLADARRRPR